MVRVQPGACKGSCLPNIHQYSCLHAASDILCSMLSSCVSYHIAHSQAITIDLVRMLSRQTFWEAQHFPCMCLTIMNWTETFRICHFRPPPRSRNSWPRRQQRLLLPPLLPPLHLLQRRYHINLDCVMWHFAVEQGLV